MSIEWDYRLLRLNIYLKELTKQDLDRIHNAFEGISYDVQKAICQWEDYCKDNNIEIPNE